MMGVTGVEVGVVCLGSGNEIRKAENDLKTDRESVGLGSARSWGTKIGTYKGFKTGTTKFGSGAEGIIRQKSECALLNGS